MLELCQKIKQLKTETNRAQNKLFGMILENLHKATKIKYRKAFKEWQFDIDDIRVCVQTRGRSLNIAFSGGFVVLHNQAYYWEIMERLDKIPTTNILVEDDDGNDL